MGHRPVRLRSGVLHFFKLVQRVASLPYRQARTNNLALRTFHHRCASGLHAIAAATLPIDMKPRILQIIDFYHEHLPI
jgi:hypothetical protein